MCGIAAMCGRDARQPELDRMVQALSHRGPDAHGTFIDAHGPVALGHTRLSILDLSAAGRQPMVDGEGRFFITFNGEIYNYLELRAELEDTYPFRTGTDTEVLLAAYRRWGTGCLSRLIGMFAFVIWDTRERRLFAARDRFGVKPLYVSERPDGGLWLASEIKALHAAGVAREPEPTTWATYFATGLYDHGERTFWQHIQQLPPGHHLTWTPAGSSVLQRWYDIAQSALAQGEDARQETVVMEELAGLLEHSVRLRFRADVPVGVCLSGGLDSSLLLGLVGQIHGAAASLKTFTFDCGDASYDETPWVNQMLERTGHQACFCRLTAAEIPQLAQVVQRFQDEPFGGFPTLGMAKVHERARAEGVTVLLDGNGMDEGWAGYEYYGRAGSVDLGSGPVQGSKSRSTRPDCLEPDFLARAQPMAAEAPFGHPLRDLQYRDIRRAKIPRAMRFADRVSMMHSRELREPFLDHRILELGLRQPMDRLLRGGQGKWLPRRVAESLLPDGVREAPKRPVQTPQREWLRGPLAQWAGERIEDALQGWGGAWLNPKATRLAWREFVKGEGDNSFMIWQWISLGLMSQKSSPQENTP